MTDRYTPVRPRARVVAAVLGLVAAAGLMGAVLALDVHYDHAFLQAQQGTAAAQHAAAHPESKTVHG